MDRKNNSKKLPWTDCDSEQTNLFLNEIDRIKFESFIDPHDMDRHESDDEPLDPPSAVSRCSICRKKLKARWLPNTCLHKFCFICGNRWMNIQKVCPVCKKPKFSLICWPAPSYRFSSTSKIYEDSEDYLETVYSFRKKIYSQNVWVEDLAEVCVCYKEFTPELYSDHPSQTQRLTPWLKREVYSILNYLGSPDYSDDIVKRILNMLPYYPIQSQEFETAIEPYFGEHTNHFVHEFYMFACSFFDTHGFDDHAFYYATSSEGQICALNLYFDVQKKCD